MTHYIHYLKFYTDLILGTKKQIPQSLGKDYYFHYVPTFDPFFTNNITIPNPITPTVQDTNSPNESPEFSIVDDHPDHHEPAEIHSDTFDSQNITINDEPISGPQASITARSRVRDFEAASAHECLYMDIKSAFLNKKLPKEVYVQQPPGFESSEFPNYVCKLDKAPSGLKQANRAWYETLTTFLIKHKFVKGTIDNTLST
ncbi:retrovirus-related pol polyprotein from transposon TNT 1-94 [Tanacetum coccineum]